MVKRYFIILVIMVVSSGALVGCGVTEAMTTSTETQTTTEITNQEKATTINTEGTDLITDGNLEQRLIQLLISQCEATQNYSDNTITVEREILVEFLKWPDNNGHYVVVSPEISIGSYEDHKDNFQNMVDRKDYIISWFGELGYDISTVMESFLEMNKQSSLLEIESSIVEGYFINYDDNYWKYLAEVSSEEYQGGKGWWSFVDENFQNYSGDLKVSMPAYDSETDYVLLYVYVVSWLGAEHGHGWSSIRLMKYTDGSLDEICDMELVSTQTIRTSDYEPYGDD